MLFPELAGEDLAQRRPRATVDLDVEVRLVADDGEQLEGEADAWATWQDGENAPPKRSTAPGWPSRWGWRATRWAGLQLHVFHRPGHVDVYTSTAGGRRQMRENMERVRREVEIWLRRRAGEEVVVEPAPSRARCVACKKYTTHKRQVPCCTACEPGLPPLLALPAQLDITAAGEVLTCGGCGKTWWRFPRPGPTPKRCPDCGKAMRRDVMRGKAMAKRSAAQGLDDCAELVDVEELHQVAAGVETHVGAGGARLVAAESGAGGLNDVDDVAEPGEQDGVKPWPWEEVPPALPPTVDPLPAGVGRVARIRAGVGREGQGAPAGARSRKGHKRNVTDKAEVAP